MDVIPPPPRPLCGPLGRRFGSLKSFGLREISLDVPNGRSRIFPGVDVNASALYQELIKVQQLLAQGVNPGRSVVDWHSFYLDQNLVKGLPFSLYGERQLKVSDAIRKCIRIFWWFKFVLPAKYRSSRFGGFEYVYVKGPLGIFRPTLRPYWVEGPINPSLQWGEGVYRPALYNVIKQVLSLHFGKIHNGETQLKDRMAVGIKRLYAAMESTDGTIYSMYLRNMEKLNKYEWLARQMEVLQNMLNPGFPSLLKKEKKRFRKAYFMNVKYDISPIGNPMRIYRGFLPESDYGSRAFGWEVMMITQTRSLANPGKWEMDLSKKKFIKTLTQPGEECKVDVRRYIADYFADADWRISRFWEKSKIIFGSSASYSYRRKDGGQKVGLHEMFCKFKTSYYVSLHDFEERLATRELTHGEKIFYTALNRIRILRSQSKAPRHRFAQISEPGMKSRSLTMNEEYFTAVLSPYSKVTLELLKNFPETSSGVSEERHGWKAIHDFGLQFDPKLKYFGLSYDLEEATDHISFDVAEKILVSLNEILGIPKAYGQLVIDLICAPHIIEIPGRKDPIRNLRGILMGSPVTKTILTMLQIVAWQMTLSKHNRLPNFGRFVGDDGLVISTSKKVLEDHLQNLKSLCVKVAEDDTYISDRYVHFTEELLMIPQNRTNTIEYCIGTGDYSRLPYVDYVRTKLLMMVGTNCPMDTLDPLGKFSLLGKEQKYTRGLEVIEKSFEVASLIQDVKIGCQLTTNQYVPTIYGGGGKIPYNYTVFMSTLNNCGPGYRRYVLSLIKHAVWFKRGRENQLSYFARFGVRHNRFFKYDTWRAKIEDDPLPSYFNKYIILPVKEAETLHPQVYGKLCQLCVTEGKLKTDYFSQQEVLFYIETGIEPDREEEDVEKVNFKFSDTPAPTKAEVEEFFQEQKEQMFSFVKRDTLYDPTVVDIMHSKFLNVELTVKPKLNFQFRDYVPDKKIEHELVVGLRKGELPTDLIEDDSVILKENSKWEQLRIIVTDDNRLCKKLCKTTKKVLQFKAKGIHKFFQSLVSMGQDEFQLFLPGPPMKELDYIDKDSFENFIEEKYGTRRVIYDIGSLKANRVKGGKLPALNDIAPVPFGQVQGKVLHKVKYLNKTLWCTPSVYYGVNYI